MYLYQIGTNFGTNYDTSSYCWLDIQNSHSHGGVNMDKKLSIAATTFIATIGTTGMMFSSNLVSAATENDSQVQKATDAKTDAQNQLANDTTKQNEAAKDVAASSGKLDAAKQATADAQKNVNNAATSATQTQNAKDSAQKEADAATPEAVTNTQNGIKDAQQAATDAQGAVDKAKTAVEPAQTAQDSAQKEADAASKAVDTQQKVVDAKSDAVDAAEAKLDNSDLANAQKELGRANDKLATNQATADQAAKDVKADSKAVTDAQSKVDEINRQGTGATEIDAAQKESDAKNDALKTAQSDVKTAQTSVDTLQKQLDASAVQNTITLPTGADKNLFATMQNADLATIQANAGTWNTTLSAGNALNTFKSNDADKKVAINSSSDITPEIQQELTTFAASLINGIRAQLGTNPVVVTPGAIKFAGDVAANYDADNWDVFDKQDHDVPAVTKAAASNGLNDAGQLYENLQSSIYHFNADPTVWNTTLDGLKELVYNAVKQMMFGDMMGGTSVPLHALSLAGLIYTDDGTQTEYFGMDFDKIGQIHLETINKENIVDAAKLDNATSIAIPGTDTPKLQSQLADAKQELSQKQTAEATAKTAADTAASALSSIQAKYSDVAAKLATAKQVLAKAQAKLATDRNTAKAATDAITADKTAIDAATQKVAELEKTADEAQKQQAQAVADAQKELSEEQTKLDGLKATATEKAKALAKAQGELKDAKTAVTEATKALTDAQSKVDALQKQLVTYQNAATKLEAANKAADEAETKLTAAKKVLADATAAQQAAQSDYDTAVSAKNVIDSAVARDQELLKKIEDAENITNTLPDINTDHTVTTKPNTNADSTVVSPDSTPEKDSNVTTPVDTKSDTEAKRNSAETPSKESRASAKPVVTKTVPAATTTVQGSAVKSLATATATAKPVAKGLPQLGGADTKTSVFAGMAMLAATVIGLFGFAVKRREQN